MTPQDFEELERNLKDSGPDVALERLTELLEGRGESRALLDAMLLKARHDLGLPLVLSGGLSELPEPTRTQYEDRYVEAIRIVGRRMLDAGDIPAAWPYFRAIAEKEPVAEALENYEPTADGDESIGQVVEIAFGQGAHPRRGFELILSQYGPCSAITAFEHLPPEESIRSHCADRLTRHLRDQLIETIRAEIGRRGEPEPSPGANIPDLIAGRDWLFEEDAYHIDTSHLSAVVRMGPLLADPETIRQAIELTDYGRRLSSMHRYDGEPPFEQTYEDHAAYLRALLGENVEEALALFRSRLEPPDPDGTDMASTLPAQILARLLVRLDRLEEAIELVAEHLSHVPESMLMCPGLPSLCQQAGRPDLLAEHARSSGDLVQYAAAILQNRQQLEIQS